jgi:mercuric ion transport protein
MNLQAVPAKATASREAVGIRLVALALVSTLLASTCCVLPLVLVLVGISGAWMTHLVAMKPFTPLFVALALGALGGSGYLLFRPATVCSGDPCATARPVTRRIYVACAVFIALLLGFPLVAPLFY